ncbi:MAG: NAD-dependent epimerase/dehydratase family protein [Actinobacteria bacterium]|nr:NAD-dependent epimerase/dehydratase family protein [Actinomycetota bacterium]
MGRGKRILITGVSSYLGLRLAKRFEHDDDIEAIIGVDLQEPPVPIGKLDFVPADIRNPLIARVLDSTEVDTVIHTNISSHPSRLGGRSQMKENNVMGTLQLLAAAQRVKRVTRVLMKSSTAVYGMGPKEPSIVREDHDNRYAHLYGYGKDCSEAETYVRDFARRRRDVEVVILRMQSLIGPTVRTNMSDYLSLPVIPTAVGYDPRLQLVHEEDAVEAFALATHGAPKGIYNITGRGVVFLSKAIRMLGKVGLPMLYPAATAAGSVLRRVGTVDFPPDQLQFLIYGRVVDYKRAREEFGFVARYTTEEAIADFRDRRRARDEVSA